MKIAVGFAGPDISQITRDYVLPMQEEQMIIASLQSNWALFLKSLEDSEPDLLVIFADLAPGIDALVDRLALLHHAVAVVLLPPGWADLQGVLEKVESVRGVYVLPAAPAEVLRRGIGAVNTELARRQASSPLSSILNRSERQPGVVGTRVIAFVSAQGGVGKSTLAESLGFELSARRSIRSLLFSFDLPASATLRLGIRSQPSAQEYFAQPGPSGFKEALQTTRDDLEVILAPSSSFTYAHAMLPRPEESQSIRSLVVSGFSFNYGAILLDLPSGESAWTLQPLLVANVVLIISRPTLEGIRATAHTVRLLTEDLQVSHRLPKESLFLVLNQRSQQSTFTASSFHKKGAEEYGWFPPILTTIDYDPRVPQAQDACRPPVSISEDLGKQVAGLVDTFYANSQMAGKDGHFKGRSFLGVRIRMRG